MGQVKSRKPIPENNCFKILICFGFLKGGEGFATYLG